jgi:hypothetical protein
MRRGDLRGPPTRRSSAGRLITLESRLMMTLTAVPEAESATLRETLQVSRLPVLSKHVAALVGHRLCQHNAPS